MYFLNTKGREEAQVGWKEKQLTGDGQEKGEIEERKRQQWPGVMEM